MKKTLLLLGFFLMLTSSYAQNSGLLFNGRNENLTIDRKPQFTAKDNFTIEAWIYANSWKSQSWMGSIVCNDGESVDGYAFRAGNNGQLSFVMAVDNNWNEVQSASVMNVDQWHHVAITIGGGVMTLYIDGAPSGTEPYSGNITPGVNGVNIGESTGFPGRYWDGIIDEVRIWNVTRTQQELIDNSAVDLQGTEAGLVLYLPMNEGSGNTAGNLVDANCSASLFNMDDSNWVDGYTIPDFDVSLNPIEGIDVVNMKYRPVKFSASVKNLGKENLDGVKLIVNIDGDDLFTETIPETIISGEELTHNFQTPIDLTGLDDPLIMVTASHPEDQNTLNNNKALRLSTQSGDVVRLFDSKAHNFGAAGQSHLNNVLLPADLSAYEKLLVHINLTCPSGGCDPWDQPAKLSAITDKGTYEIVRYITPYRIACGPWTVDVTDFKEILSGSVTFRSFVQVWGQSGWLVTIDLEFVKGDSTYPYNKLSPLWMTDYLVYGDPDVSYDLDEVTVNVDNNTEASHIRTTISGHGQGNTGNAAEFSPTTHQFQMNGTSIDNHYLWKDDCAANTCDNQQGSWLFARAGWCPGQEVIPYIVATNAAAGETITLDYELEQYTNLLNTGYNGETHTEPHYRIWSYFVERSSQPYNDYQNLVCDAIMPRISGSGSNQTLDGVEITITNNGSVALSNFDVSYMINNQLISTETIDGPLAAGESMTHSFSIVNGLSAGFQNTFYGLISHPDDENIGDDVSKFFVDGLVSTEKVIDAARRIEVFPNPVQNGIFQVKADPILKGSKIDLISTDGKILRTTIVNSTNLEMTISQKGIYFLRFTHPEGFVSNKKLVVAQ